MLLPFLQLNILHSSEGEIAGLAELDPHRVGGFHTSTAEMIWLRAEDKKQQVFVVKGENEGYLERRMFIMPRLFLLRNGKLGVKPVIYRVTLKPRNEISIIEDSCLLKRLLTGIK